MSGDKPINTGHDDKPSRVSTGIESSLVRIVVSGVASSQKMIAALTSLADEPGFQPGMNFLWDFRQANPGSISTDEIRRVADTAKALSHETSVTKVAFVVASTLGFGLSRMSSAYVESDTRQPRVFTDLSEAESWLQHEPEANS